MSSVDSYVVITAARNEAEFIELTIRSVVAQTVRPVRWVVVSDGSTDDTDEIVRRYAAVHPWITLLRMPERRERHFAGKAHAFNTAREHLNDLEYGAIVNPSAGRRSNVALHRRYSMPCNYIGVTYKQAPRTRFVSPNIREAAPDHLPGD